MSFIDRSTNDVTELTKARPSAAHRGSRIHSTRLEQIEAIRIEEAIARLRDNRPLKKHLRSLLIGVGYGSATCPPDPSLLGKRARAHDVPESSGFGLATLEAI